MDENGLILKSKLNRSEGGLSYYYHNVRTTHVGVIFFEIQQDSNINSKNFFSNRNSRSV